MGANGVETYFREMDVESSRFYFGQVEYLVDQTQ